MSESVKSYKRDAIKAARQLKYSDYILARLNNATTEDVYKRQEMRSLLV